MGRLWCKIVRHHHRLPHKHFSLERSTQYVHTLPQSHESDIEVKTNLNKKSHKQKTHWILYQFIIIIIIIQ